MVEQAKNETNGPSAPEASAEKATPRKRVISEIEFPYSDLELAAELAKTLHARAGNSSTDDELAAWLDQSATGGTYRARRAAARMFGLIELTQGKVGLTELGRDIADTRTERAARVDAFLKPALFQVMYEQGKGRALPPPPAIERQMEQLGVSPKQTDRARQVFQKSAIYAGFINSATGRFVKPGNGASEREPERDETQKKREGGSGGGGPDDPLIAALIQKLPPNGKWPAADRVVWLKMATMAFDLAYGRDAEIEIKTGAGGG